MLAVLRVSAPVRERVGTEHPTRPSSEVLFKSCSGSVFGTAAYDERGVRFRAIVAGNWCQNTLSSWISSSSEDPYAQLSSRSFM